MNDIFSKPTMSVGDAGEMLGLSRNAAYDAAKRGDIPTIKVGSRILVVTAKFREMLDARVVPTPTIDIDAIVDQVTARVLKKLAEALR